MSIIGRTIAQAVSFSPRISGFGFAPSAVHVGFMIHKVATKVFLRVLLCPAVNIIPPMLHIHSHVPSGEIDNGPISGPGPVSLRHSAPLLNSNININNNIIPINAYVFHLLSYIRSKILYVFLISLVRYHVSLCNSF
jgi:hypothetical protein